MILSVSKSLYTFSYLLFSYLPFITLWGLSAILYTYCTGVEYGDFVFTYVICHIGRKMPFNWLTLFFTPD